MGLLGVNKMFSRIRDRLLGTSLTEYPYGGIQRVDYYPSRNEARLQYIDDTKETLRNINDFVFTRALEVTKGTVSDPRVGEPLLKIIAQFDFGAGYVEEEGEGPYRTLYIKEMEG